MKTPDFWGAMLTCGLLAFAASGCGSDDKDSTENASETPAASSSSRGSAGAGMQMTTRGEVTTDECIVQTEVVFGLRSDGYGRDCITCLCTQSPRTIALCDDQADICWGLIGCVSANCAGAEGLDQANCAVGMCGQFIEGSGLAMAIGAIMQGEACSAKCPPKQ